MLDHDFAAVLRPDRAADDSGHDPPVAVLFRAFHRIPVQLGAHGHKECAQYGEQGKQQQNEQVLDHFGGMAYNSLTQERCSPFRPL